MTLHDAQSAVVTLGLTLLATAFLLAFLQVGECSECPHCRNKRTAARAEKRAAAKARERKQHEWFHRVYAVKLGDETCPTCKANPPSPDGTP